MTHDRRMAGPRVRFAPSPTGYLHVGGARTALFNWLYARKTGGTFILRIEDTDLERSSADMVEGILDGLRWLGLDWDEGPQVGGPHEPYFQSGRAARYRDAAERLVRSGHAYRCYCTPESLRQRRDEAQRRGETWQYDRTCLRLSDEERERMREQDMPCAIRFRVPDADATGFHDVVHGDISFENAHIEDFVILRSDALPTYHLSVVVDDVDMGVTDVVRGDDHISNTPKQLLLYHALGRPVPRFAHVPLILGPDKKRLSKRHGATSVMEYQRQGYVPEGMVNFLALLGWSPGDDRELFTRDELIEAFSLDGISGGNAVFNPEKLDWFNGQHLVRLDSAELLRRIEPDLRETGIWHDDLTGERSAWVCRVIDLLKPRARRLPDLVAGMGIFLRDTIEYDGGAVTKYLTLPGLDEHLQALRTALATVEPFEEGAIEGTLRHVAAARSIKAAPLIHATRVAATGQAVSPGLFEVLALLGRERTIARIEAAESVAARAAAPASEP